MVMCANKELFNSSQILKEKKMRLIRAIYLINDTQNLLSADADTFEKYILNDLAKSLKAKLASLPTV